MPVAGENDNCRAFFGSVKTMSLNELDMAEAEPPTFTDSLRPERHDLTRKMARLGFSRATVQPECKRQIAFHASHGIRYNASPLCVKPIQFTQKKEAVL